MMTLSPGSLDAGQAEDYFEQHYTHDDYYSEQHTTVGQWVGTGAADLGMAGDVSQEDFTALLKGIHPRSGAVLVPHHNGVHRAGWDSVFSAPKSISIQALVGGDQRLIEAHTKAVQRTLAEFERFALTWEHGGRARVVSGNIVGASFTHLAARPSIKNDRGPDPHLHTHVVLLNVTRRPDGQWRGLEPWAMYGSQQFASAVYGAELAREVQILGYRIQISGSHGAWELEGYNREQVMAFSQRRQDIEQAMAEKGLSGPQAAQIIALQTRSSKTDYDQDALKAEWQQRAADHGVDTHAVRRAAWARSIAGEAVDNTQAARDALQCAKEHTTEREAVIDRRALEAAALVQGMGQVDLDAVRAQIAAEQQEHKLIPAGRTDWLQPTGSFTTDEMVALERSNLALVRGGIGTATPIADARRVQVWAQQKQLFADQTAAAELSITSTHWVTAIEGLAGSTKTTTVGAIREMAERQGYQVEGFGMTSGSVKELRTAGVPARTVASLLENPVVPAEARLAPARARGKLWFVDESSLLATRPVNRLLKLARDQGVDRIVFVGDQRQHFAIEAGSPIRQLLRDNLAVAELTNIRRQHDPVLRQVVEWAANRQVRAALDTLDKRGDIVTIAEKSQRYERIAADYVQGYEQGAQTLVVSPANQERQDLNLAIRNILITRGHIAKGEERQHTILVQRDLTKPQQRYAHNYDLGDVLLFRRGSKRLGIEKRGYATVESIDTKGNVLGVRAADGHSVNLNPARWGGISVYQSESRLFAVGDRLQFRAPNRPLQLANGELGTIIKLNAEGARVRLDNGRELDAPLKQLRHCDYGYASTSHSAQGTTVDRVIVNVDSMRSAQLVNQRQFYVSISRARTSIRIYTDDQQTLERSVSRKVDKSIALEALQPAPIAPQQSYGMRP